MRLHTCYRSIEAAGPDGCEHYAALVESVGIPECYGMGRPISLETVLDVCGLRDALWALNVVYPEQRVAASRIARRLAILTYQAVESRFHSPHPFLAGKVELANGYLEGSVGLAELAAARRVLWEKGESSAVDPAMRKLISCGWMMTVEWPERLARDLFYAIKWTFPDGMRQRARRHCAGDPVRVLEPALRGLLWPNDGCEIGPGCQVEPRTRPYDVTSMRGRLERSFDMAGI